MNNTQDDMFLRRVDEACKRMNPGLTAVAAVLALAVICVATIRGSEIIETAGGVLWPSDSLTYN